MSDQISKHADEAARWWRYQPGPLYDFDCVGRACQRAIDSARPEIVAEATAGLREQVAVLQSQLDNADLYLEQAKMNAESKWKSRVAELRAEIERLKGELKTTTDHRDDILSHKWGGIFALKDRAETAERKVEELTFLGGEFYAMVRGECPSILEDDHNAFKFWEAIQSVTRKEGEPVIEGLAEVQAFEERSKAIVDGPKIKSEVQPLGGGATWQPCSREEGGQS